MRDLVSGAQPGDCLVCHGRFTLHNSTRKLMFVSIWSWVTDTQSWRYRGGWARWRYVLNNQHGHLLTSLPDFISLLARRCGAHFWRRGSCCHCKELYLGWCETPCIVTKILFNFEHRISKRSWWTVYVLESTWRYDLLLSADCPFSTGLVVDFWLLPLRYNCRCVAHPPAWLRVFWMHNYLQIFPMCIQTISSRSISLKKSIVVGTSL